MESVTNTTNDTARDASAGVTSLHVTAVDGIVNMNSLITVAIFIGFSFTTPEDAHAGSRLGCTASREIIRQLVVYEVVSFSFFLYSSLVAQTLKLAVNLINMVDLNDPHKAKIHQNALKYGMFGLATSSVDGSVFLVLSIVDFVQMKLGVYLCGGKSGLWDRDCGGLFGFGLLVYVGTAAYVSFFVEASSERHHSSGKLARDNLIPRSTHWHCKKIILKLKSLL